MLVGRSRGLDSASCGPATPTEEWRERHVAPWDQGVAALQYQRRTGQQNKRRPTGLPAFRTERGKELLHSHLQRRGKLCRCAKGGEHRGLLRRGGDDTGNGSRAGELKITRPRRGTQVYIIEEPCVDSMFLRSTRMRSTVTLAAIVTLVFNSWAASQGRWLSRGSARRWTPW